MFTLCYTKLLSEYNISNASRKKKVKIASGTVSLFESERKIISQLRKNNLHRNSV